ncbi:unnamed protein product [Withania somnifera]
MAGNNRNRNFAIIGVCSVILVAMVVAVVVTMNWNHKEDKGQDVTSTKKAIESICQTTHYQHTCVENLESSADGSTDPKDLIQKSFQVTMKKIKEAIDNSTFMQKVEKDPRAKMALDNCKKLGWQAVSDINRTYAKFDSFEFNDMSHWIADLKIWLSGAITYQETCLDGFEKTTGETGERMKAALNSSMELSSNALSMITEISAVFTSLNSGSNTLRRLLFDGTPVLGHGTELLPDWIDMGRRRLLAVNISTGIKPDMVVAKDGSGKYKTINEALKNIPQNRKESFVLYIKQGVYNEKLEITSTMTHLVLIGDGPTKTRITGNQNFKDGMPTQQTATVAIMGDYFIAKDIGFENSAGPEKHQAIALRVASINQFFTIAIWMATKTRYASTPIDNFIEIVLLEAQSTLSSVMVLLCSGSALSRYESLRKSKHRIVTRQGRTDARRPTGLVFQSCSIVVMNLIMRSREKSRHILVVHGNKGWLEWNKTFAFDTLFYAEFNNIGSGSSKTKRVNRVGVKELPIDRVQRFTASKFLDGDAWIPSAGIPYSAGFFLPPPQQDASVKYSPVDEDEYRDSGSGKDKPSYESRL